MDKAKARKMYELATRLSSVNANELSEQQLSERNSMITRLQEEMTKMREGHTVPTATGVRHQASPGVYGGSDRDEDPDTKLDKNFVNRAEKAIGIKWGREKKRAPGINLDDSLNGMAEEIIGQPDFEHTGNAGYGSYGAAEYTATTKHRLGSHVYEVTTEQDGDGDFSYFIYENDKEIFSSIQPSNRNQLGHRVSSALLDEHKKATAHLFDSDVAEEIIGQPDFEHTGNAGRGSYSAAEYTATTKHQLGSHVYEVTTEQDGDGDFSYFIYENGKEIFSSIQPSNKNQLGHRISSALLDEHKKATAHLFDSDDDDDDYYEANQGMAEGSEQIDELSPETLKSYANKARAQVRASPGAKPRSSHLPTDPKIANRARGAVKADNRLHGFGPVKKSTQGVAEDGHEDMNGAPASGAVHYNVGKLSKEIGTDPRQLKIAIQRSITGNPTRQDTLTVANAFISILKTGDDQTIQNIANIIKAGNPRKDSAQESVAPKVTKAEEVKEEINTEAYNRLRKVFDFSNFKG